MTTTLLLRARPVSRRHNDVMMAAYDIYEGTSAIPTYSVIWDGHWFVEPVAGPYGVFYDQKDNARAMNARIACAVTFQLADVLAEVRTVLEAFDHMMAEEAKAEMETERRAEAFWENRMSDEDKAREDWEYSMYGA